MLLRSGEWCLGERGHSDAVGPGGSRYDLASVGVGVRVKFVIGDGAAEAVVVGSGAWWLFAVPFCPILGMAERSELG